MTLFGFFSLILVLIYWVNRAVILFDQLIADGQSAGVFVEFTALSLPNVIRLVLPMSAFAAAVYVTNRLTSESELTVMRATGFSPWRLARPALVFGLIVAALMTALAHVLVPASIAQLSQREAEIANNVTERILVDGTFLHPADGITFYIREISPQGELLDVFLTDNRVGTSRTTYTATKAFLVRSDTGPKLVMVNGQAQTLEGERLFTTSFRDFSYDIGALIQSNTDSNRGIRALSTRELFLASDALLEETGNSRERLLQEAHRRVAQPLLGLVAALIGFAALLSGGFSRFGVWRQIIGAICLLILIKLIESAVTDMVRRDASLWPLIYLPAATGLGITGVLLHLSARADLLGRFRRRVA
jgi:lipopolysaccharide export system permease protein